MLPPDRHVTKARSDRKDQAEPDREQRISDQEDQERNDRKQKETAEHPWNSFAGFLFDFQVEASEDILFLHQSADWRAGARLLMIFTFISAAIDGAVVML